MNLDPEDVPYPTSRFRLNALRAVAIGLGVVVALVLVLAIAS